MDDAVPDKEFTDKELEYLVPYTLSRRGEKTDRVRWNPPRLPEARQQHGIQAKDGEMFLLVFEDVNSDWEQFATLATDWTISVDGSVYKRAVMIPFEETHSEHRIHCRTKEGILWVWNSYQYRGTQGELIRWSCESFAGMLVEELPNGYRYRCNEGEDDDDYDDLIFRIERTGKVELPRRGRRKREEESKETSKPGS